MESWYEHGDVAWEHGLVMGTWLGRGDTAWGHTMETQHRDTAWAHGMVTGTQHGDVAQDTGTAGSEDEEKGEEGSYLG